MSRRRTHRVALLPGSDQRMDLHHLVHPPTPHSSPTVTHSPLCVTSQPLIHPAHASSHAPSHSRPQHMTSDPTQAPFHPTSSIPPPPRTPAPPRCRTQSNNWHRHYNHVDESHSAPIISSTPLPVPPLPPFGATAHGHGQQQPRRQRAESDSSSIITARRDFAVAITRPSPRRGYLQCRLCDREVWGPNGTFCIFIRQYSSLRNLYRSSTHMIKRKLSYLWWRRHSKTKSN